MSVRITNRLLFKGEPNRIAKIFEEIKRLKEIQKDRTSYACRQ